jgi:hypothetical protein
MLKIIILALMQLSPIFILIMMRRIAPNFLLFESIILATLLPMIFFLLVNKLRNIKIFFKNIFASPLVTILFSSLIIFNLLFFSLMMVDRSKSLYVIKWVGDSQPISRENLFKQVGVIKNSNDEQYIEIRIKEQLYRKVLSENGGLLHLTAYGSLLKNFADMTAKIFLLKGWESTNFK